MATVFVKCVRHDCPCTMTWNGKDGEHCCRTCRQGTACSHLRHGMPAAAARCVNPDCVCTTTYNGLEGFNCCLTCFRGIPCKEPRHAAKMVVGAPTAVEFSKAPRMLVAPGGSAGEYEAVKKLFTVSHSELVVVRVQNWDTHERMVQKRVPDRVMFHGCKSAANEEAICREGFRTDQCRSCVDSRRGSWFAQDPNYSHSSFAFTDAAGWTHLFMCLVSNATVLKEGPIRVVGDDCAYPLYILLYR